MKITVFAAVFFVSLAVSCAFYGWLESSANMIEGLRQFLQPGAGPVIFSPLLVLFILLTLGVFAGTSLLAVVTTAFLGGTILRSHSLSVPKSFARAFVLIGVISHFAFIIVALKLNAPFLLDRPRLHPNIWLVTFMAAANAAIDLSSAAFILWRRTRTPALPVAL